MHSSAQKCPWDEAQGFVVALLIISATRYETRQSITLWLVADRRIAPPSLTAILADPYLSCPGLSRVRSCMYMVDLIMITARCAFYLPMYLKSAPGDKKATKKPRADQLNN